MWWPQLWKTKTILTALPEKAESTRFLMETGCVDVLNYFISYMHEDKAECAQVTKACYFRELHLKRQDENAGACIRDLHDSLEKERSQHKRHVAMLEANTKDLKTKCTKYVNWVMSRPNAGDEIPF